MSSKNNKLLATGGCIHKIDSLEDKLNSFLKTPNDKFADDIENEFKHLDILIPISNLSNNDLEKYNRLKLGFRKNNSSIRLYVSIKGEKEQKDKNKEVEYIKKEDEENNNETEENRNSKNDIDEEIKLLSPLNKNVKSMKCDDMYFQPLILPDSDVFGSMIKNTEKHMNKLNSIIEEPILGGQNLESINSSTDSLYNSTNSIIRSNSDNFGYSNDNKSKNTSFIIIPEYLNILINNQNENINNLENRYIDMESAMEITILEVTRNLQRARKNNEFMRKLFIFVSILFGMVCFIIFI